MSDLYKNFAFCQATVSIGATDLTITVDDTSSLPTNTDLASADFWLTIESTLTHPNTFEIVKLTNVNTGTNVLTVTRGQESTTGQAHSSGAVLKGALTAAMLTRLAPSRATATATTSSLAAGASDSSTTITLAKGYVLYSIQTSRPARVRLYETAAAQTADASRAVGVDPVSTAGVVLDYVTPAGGTAYSLSPQVMGTNLESTPSTSISMTVTNNDTTTGTVTVTLVWVRTEW